MQVKNLTSICVLFSAFISSAGSMDLKGTVINQAGKPVNKAVVTLVGKNLKDTTDATGAFKISEGTFTNGIADAQKKAVIGIERGSITFTVTRTTPVRIEQFNLRGMLIGKIMDRPVAAGRYRLDIPTRFSATTMQIISVSTGKQTASFRFVQPDQKNVLVSGSYSTASAQEPAAKVATVIDSLKVSASGYLLSSISIISYTEAITVRLDTISLAKFSFFVTSLSGLQALSGSEKGFGGDFRFGKTGQGAGLLGADSICQCLAERSMPGSKVKQWRAFLSVAKGPDGKQVNAIDRIGSGPWYDRLGRRLGNNLSELIGGDRPANADPAIKNDFPNEDGVPNHRPDPNKPQVDNHMFVTGSDKSGKLCTSAGGSSTGATCDDWTTATSTTSRPRCGLSWPQAMGGGMKNWISQMNGAGCLPGIDLTEESKSGTPGVYTIGNGGGYGGFYCFALNP